MPTLEPFEAFLAVTCIALMFLRWLAVAIIEEDDWRRARGKLLPDRRWKRPPLPWPPPMLPFDRRRLEAKRAARRARIRAAIEAAGRRARAVAYVVSCRWVVRLPGWAQAIAWGLGITAPAVALLCYALGRAPRPCDPCPARIRRCIRRLSVVCFHCRVGNATTPRSGAPQTWPDWPSRT